MKRGYLIALLIIAALGAGIASYSRRSPGNMSGNVPPEKNEQALKALDTSGWQTYENKDYGFTFKFPKDWKMQRTFPGRLGAGKTEFNPLSDPHVYDLSPNGEDTTKTLSEVSLYVAPPGFFSCPPLDSSNDGSGYIDAPAQPITVSGVSGLTRSGRVFGAATPGSSYAREVYVCTAHGYFRFSTPLLSSATFAGVLSTFHFIK